MKTFCVFPIFLSVLVLSVDAEYKLCATSDKDTLCKLIEASDSGVTCVQVSDSVDCLLKMQKNEAHFGTFTAEEAFLAAHFLEDAAVVLSEVRHVDRAANVFGFETVVVVREDFSGGLSALKGMSYCHPGFSKAQYWSDRVLKDFESKALEHFEDDIKCNAAVRSAYEDDLYRLSMIFSKACRPGSWAVSEWWDKKLKREYHSLCAQCEHPNTCSYKVQNKGRHSDALRCVVLHGGNVTYTALEYVQEYFGLNEELSFSRPHPDPASYNFLCRDGSTRPLTSSDSCSWIKQPWTSIIALSSTQPKLQTDLRSWLDSESESDFLSPSWAKHLHQILAKKDGVLKFREKALTVSSYLKEGRSIPAAAKETCRGAVKWCTVSGIEMKKCEYLSTAALIHGLPFQIRCIEGRNKIDCFDKINNREADVVYIDTELGYISRKVFNLTTAAYLETRKTGNYYGVAVVKGNSIKKLKQLQGKRACFPQYNGLGWLSFVHTLKDLRIIPGRSCSNHDRVWKYFSKACAPGAMNPKISTKSKKVPESLCKACANSNAGSSCEATTKNPYFGEIGALRCLNNEDGDVAFLDYYFIKKYLDSDRKNTDDHRINVEELKILCKDGTVQDFNSSKPENCFLTQLNGGEVVTRNDLDEVVRNDIVHTLLELDDLFGTTSRHYNPVMKMFEPFNGETNVLFKESAVSLVSAFATQNSFVNNYKNLINDLENCLGESGSTTLFPSIFTIVFSAFFIFYHF